MLCKFCGQHEAITLNEKSKKRYRRKFKKEPPESICNTCLSRLYNCEQFSDVQDKELRTRLNAAFTSLQNAKRLQDVSFADSVLAMFKSRAADLDAQIHELLSRIHVITERRNEFVSAHTSLELKLATARASVYEGRRKQADKVISDEITRLTIMGRDGNACRSCGRRDELSIDHILAVINGGGDEFENLQTLCRVCNSKKGRTLI